MNMIQYFLVIAFAGVPVFATSVLARAGQPALRNQTGICEPLRDAAVTRAPDGAYYLTGTAGTFDKAARVDFDYNRGVPLWRSDDLRAWTRVGFAWDRVERFAQAPRGAHGRQWLDWSAPAERIDALLANATTTPKLYYIAGDWYLLCAQNNQNVFVFNSESGRPEGPYVDHGYLATRGGWPSFFVDEQPAPPHAAGGRAVRAVYLVLADRLGFEVVPELISGRKATAAQRDSADHFRMRRENGFTPDSTRLHVQNFLDCVRSRRRPVADVELGHHASNVAPLANIAYKTGRKLRWDGQRERFINDPEADRLLTRQPREPWNLI